MSFSSGVFTLVAGNPVVTGTTISSTVQNNTMNDVATGLSTCLLKDGTQTATATIPFTNITASGLVDISNASAGQIKFPSTQNASSNANTLDDYSEGLWTPIDASGAGLSFTVTADGCNYRKLGSLVFVNFDLTYPATADGSTAKIGGLPFTVRNQTHDWSSGIMAATNLNLTFCPLVGANATTFRILNITAALQTNANLSTAQFRGSFTYASAN